VILKPSEWSPFAGDILARAVQNTSLPTGIFQLVHGGADVGTQLVTDPRIKAVSFTGRYAVGLMIAQNCAADLKPVHLELGGVNPLIVLDDADLDQAAEHIVTALTALNGQWRRAMGRLLVHRKSYHALLRKVLDRLEALIIGDSLSPDSDMGPLIHLEHHRAIEDTIERLMWNGGVVHQAGRLPTLPGYFIQPTLITNCQPTDTVSEIFGPVAAVHLFKDDAEAIALANQPESGWAGYIFSGDEDHARQIAAEMQIASVTINSVSLFGQHPSVPRSAWGYSGLGEIGVAETIRFFGGTRAVDVAGS
jgi:phenylacetaldehyde dehydrogenase